MPKEQVIHQHITKVEPPSQDIDAIMKMRTENTEQRMLREMQKQFGQHGHLINHLAGRVDGLSAAAHALANKVPPDPIFVQGPARLAGIARPAGIAGADGKAGVDGVAVSTGPAKGGVKRLSKKMILKLKSKRPTLLATASSNDPPPGAPPGGAAALNPIVEAPAQLQATNIDVQVEPGPVQYKAPPVELFVSNLEAKLEARLAKVKSKSAAKAKKKPQTWDLPSPLR